MPEVKLDGAAAPKDGTAEARYTQLQPGREPFLRRAWEASRLTIPSLLPEAGHTSHADLYKPYQSVGARGVNNLASKLLLTQMPPSTPFFKLSIDPYQLEAMKAEAGEQVVTEVNEALGRLERAVMSDIETKTDRVTAFEAYKHLIVTGNALLFDDDKQGLRLFHLDTFVCQRDPYGHLHELVVLETLSPSVVSDEIRSIINRTTDETLRKECEKTVRVYTWLRRDQLQWHIHQEVLGEVIPSSVGTYPLDACPWFALRMIRVANEDYGRGYVEEHIGDLTSLEILSRSIVLGTSAAAKVLFLVKPHGTTRMEVLSESDTGAIVEGNEEDVTVLQMQKHNDFRVALETAAALERRLGHAFLLNSAITRDAERVTAEEIRLQAQELEDALGGFYSLLTQEFQLPYVKVKLRSLTKKPGWPKLPKGMVEPKITTGIAALGRSHERNRLINFVGTLNATFGPDAAARYINISEFARRLAVDDGIDTSGLIRSEDEIAQMDQAAQAQQIVDQLGPKVIDAISKQQVAAQQKRN